MGLEKGVFKTPFREDDVGSHGEDAFEGAGSEEDQEETLETTRTAV